jgi:predicted neuraminidase
MLRAFVFCIAIALPAIANAQEPVRELIFPVGSTSFAASHASTLVQLHDGSFESAWFGGTAEGNPDVAIWTAHKTVAGWSAPVELVREPGTPCWNPVLFHTIDGRLWLYYKFGPSVGVWTAARKYSDDEGKTWSAVEHLPAGLVGPVRAKPLVLKDGTIVSGSSVESYRSWAVWIERSVDNGKTWAKLGPFVPPSNTTIDGAKAATPADVPGSNDWKFIFGIIQPSVVRLNGKHLRYYARSTGNIGRVVAADSTDDGKTWSVPHALDVPNPNSGIDAVTLKDGRVILIYNDTPKGRSPLNLAVSNDGEHFKMFYTLEKNPGEYSYPALIQDDQGNLQMTYTWNRKSIMHVQFPLAAVPK